MCNPRLLWTLLVLAWGLLVYLNVMEVHHPRLEWVARYFWPPVGHWTLNGFFHAQVANLGPLLALIVFDTLSWGMGTRILTWLGQPGLAGVFGLGVRVALGTAAISFGALGLAMAGLAFPAVYAGTAILVAGCVPWKLRLRLRPVLVELGALAWPYKVLAGLLVVGAGAGALAPEVTDDALRFFLETARRTLVLHRLVPEEFWPFAWSPGLPVGMNLPLLALAGQGVIKLFSWQAWVFAGALIFSWLRQEKPQDGAASLAAVAWLALLNVPILAQTAMVDCTLAVWISLAVWAQFRARRPILAGLLWGCALGIKYQAGLFLAGALLVEAAMASRAGWRVLVASGLMASVWILRNALQAGVPWAPFWMVWEPGGAEVFLPSFYPFQHWMEHRSVLRALAAPFTLASGLSFWDGMFSPWLVACLPLAFTSATPVWMRAFFLLSLAGWAWQAGGVGRYLLPVFPLLLVGIGQGWPRLIQRCVFPNLLRTVVFGLLVYEACLSLHWAYYIFNPVGVALGKETRQAYIRRLLGPRPTTWETGLALRQVFHPVTRYYLADNLQGYYWPGLPVLDGEGLAPRLAHWAWASQDAGRLQVKFRQRGVTYLVHHETAWKTAGELAPREESWSPRMLAVYREYLSRYAELNFRISDEQGSYAVYKLLRYPRPARPLPPRLPLLRSLR